MKRIKISVIDFDDLRNPLLGAGQARVTYEIATRLFKMGYDITVYSSKYPGYRDREESGIKYKHIGISSRNIRLNNLAYILTLPFVVPKFKADIILECFTSPISTLFSPIFTKIPVIAISTSFEADRFAKLYHLPFDLIEKIGLKYYRYFIGFSNHLVLKIRSRNQNVVTKVIPLGVDKKYFSIRRNIRADNILYLGRLDLNQKGLDLLINAYSKVKNKIPYKLIIAGGGPDELKVRKIISDLKLDSKVKLVGTVKGKNKFDLLRNSVFTVIPSRSETFCIVALESMAAGIPLIYFDIEGLSWIDKNVSIKVKAFNEELYSRALIKLGEKNINKRLSLNSREFASHFTWDNVVIKYDGFIKEVICRESSKRL